MEERKKAMAAMDKQFEKQFEETRKRNNAREDWLKANTCPHCNQHPPIPVWLEY